MAALGAGQLGGHLTAGGAYPSRRGLLVGATVLMAGYERLLSMIVSLVLAAVVAWYLFGHIVLDIEGGVAELTKLAFGIFLATTAGAGLADDRVIARRG